jgi:CrcB protein
VTGPGFALVGLGGAAGAVLRYAVGEVVPAGRYRLGTVTVNVVGTFVLGVLSLLSVGDGAALALGTGACGAFTTFSSFSVDAVELWEQEGAWTAGGYAAGTLLAAAVALGLAWLATRPVV